MAIEYVEVTAGSGKKVAVDTVDTDKEVQYVKLMESTDGSSTPTGVNANPIQVGDAGGTLTVDGTVAVTNAGITTIAGAVAGTEMQVDVLTMPSVAVTNAGITSIDGKITACNTGAVVVSSGAITETNSGSIKTAVEALDNSVDGNYLNTNMNIAGTDVDGNSGNKSAQTLRVVLATDQPQLTAKLLTTEDNSTSIKTAVELIDNIVGSINGAGAPVIDSYQSYTITSKTGADQVIVSSAANKQIWVYGFGFTTTVTGTVAFQDEDNTVHTGAMNIDAKGGLVSSPSGNFAMPVFKLATDKDLELDIVDATINGWVCAAIVSV